MILDDDIRKLVLLIDNSSIEEVDSHIRELIQRLSASCSRTEVKAKYGSYSGAQGEIGSYPVDQEGYALSFDPLINEQEFVESWFKYGMVVGKSGLSDSFCKAATHRIDEIVYELSDGSCNLSNPKTYSKVPVDEAGVPLISRGFFEIYHDDLLAQIRQAVHIYIHHVLIWGKAELWTSFDRLGVKLPGHEESRALPLHVDQNPLTEGDGFRTVQGVLALCDCPKERGTFVAVPGSKRYFSDYKKMMPEGKGYVELIPTDPLTILLQKNAQPIPLRAGDLVSWDSRTVHSNTENISSSVRYVAYVAAGLAREDDQVLVRARNEAFEIGLGTDVREALMHASKRPRYTNQKAAASIRKKEHLNLLGRLLYGKEKYKTIRS